MEAGFRLEGRYRLERRVARRGREQVWCARDELLERRVAVTLVAVRGDRRELRRLRDAARAAAALHHPGIVTTYDYGEAEGAGGTALMYVVTEFLRGESLEERLGRGLPSPREAASICVQVADALAAAHSCGVVHGDLRPGQVFLTEDCVKLLGLGATGVAAGEANLPAPAGPGRGMPEHGTPAHDIAALGGLLARCLSGPGGSPAGPADGLAGALAELAARCRAADPGERPAAADVARELAGHASPAAPPAAGDAAPGRRRWRARRAAVVGGAAAVSAAVALVPLAVTQSSLRDVPGRIAIPPPPRTVPPAAPPPAPPVAEAPVRPPAPSRPAAPVAGAREAVVSALARMRREIDVGMARGEVSPRFGTELATEVTTLLNEVDGGARVDLRRRVARLRAALAARAPGEVSPGRAAGLAALLAEVPVPA